VNHYITATRETARFDVFGAGFYEDYGTTLEDYEDYGTTLKTTRTTLRTTRTTGLR